MQRKTFEITFRHLIPGLLLTGAMRSQAGVPAPTDLVSLSYGPLSANAVPALGSSTLALLAGLLALAAWRMLRNGHMRANRLLGTALLVGLVSATTGSIKLAKAIDFTFLLDNPNGATVRLNVGLNCVTNATSVPQQIRSITNTSLYELWTGVASFNDTFCSDGSVANAGTAPACVEDTVLQPDGVCAAVTRLD